MPAPDSADSGSTGIPRPDLMDVGGEPGDIYLEQRQQIDLGDDHAIRLMKHHRVLQRLVLALGDTYQHDLVVLAKGELRRTDQVADILDQQQVEGGKLQRLQTGGHQVGVEVTGASGGDCHYGHALSTELLGVELRGHVTLDDRTVEVALHRRQRARQQRRLAGARAAHQVEAANARRIQPAPVAVRL